MADKVVKTDAEWRAALTEEQYYVTRQGGTERPFTGAYCSEKTPGEYACVCCGAPLFDSADKFRVRHRMAELHKAGRSGQRRHAGGHELRHAPGGGSSAAVATPTSAMSSPTGRRPRGCATA